MPGGRGDFVVRRYERRDRDAVRHICFVTGYLGDPVDWQWRDPDSFADFFSGYYTDHEPGSAWVVDIDGEVRGYLLGCIDSGRAIAPTAYFAHHLLRRGLAFRPGTAGMVWRSVGDILADAPRRRLPPPRFDDPRWPAHLHIDLLPEARGRGAGAALMRSFLDGLVELGVAGCHVETVAENTRAVAFFEAMGFRRHLRAFSTPGLRSPTGGRHHVQFLVRALGPDPGPGSGNVASDG